jgi:hypothetical protein
MKLFHRYIWLFFIRIIFFHTSLNTFENTCCFFIIFIDMISWCSIIGFLFTSRITTTILFGIGWWTYRWFRIMSMTMMTSRWWGSGRRSRTTMTTRWTRTKFKKSCDWIFDKIETYRERERLLCRRSGVRERWLCDCLDDRRSDLKTNVIFYFMNTFFYLDRDRRRSLSLVETFFGWLRLRLRRDERWSPLSLSSPLRSLLDDDDDGELKKNKFICFH